MFVWAIDSNLESKNIVSLDAALAFFLYKVNELRMKQLTIVYLHMNECLICVYLDEVLHIDYRLLSLCIE